MRGSTALDAVGTDNDPVGVLSAGPGSAAGDQRQGFVSNITNPKVLVFYVAVLPQFLTPDAGGLALTLFALSHASLSLVYLLTLTAVMHRARRLFARRPVRRSLDAATGVAMLGFGARLAFAQR